MSALTPDQKAEIEERLHAKWEHERESGKLARKVMQMEKMRGRKKEKGKRIGEIPSKGEAADQQLGIGG